jgi:hypothetical protein
VAPWNEGAGWPGVGSYGIDKFNGGFDGGGYAISNLTINDSRRRAGLFTLVDGAALENIALVNVDIRTDEGWSGSLVGGVDSGPVTTISNSYATGSIVVDDEMFGDAPDDRDPNVGGLVGFAQSVHIVSSFADVQVTSSGITVGGLIGDLDGTGVDDSYAIGDVTGGDTVGGLVGVADAAVTRSYAAGAVTSGTATVGGLVGNVAAGSVAASFYDQDATGRSDTGSGAPTAGADMLKQATFAPGTADDWDFATVWAIDEDTTYPYHQWYAGPKPTP